MSFEVTTEVAGIKEALKVINTVDKSIRRGITRDYKKIMEGTVEDVRQGVPGKEPPPISGFGRSWTTQTKFTVFPWTGVVYKEQIKVGTSGKKPREYKGYTRNLATFYIQWAGTQAVVFDQAGNRGPNGISWGLEKKNYGRASRLMWPTVLDNMPQIEDQLQALTDRIMFLYSQALTGNLPKQIRQSRGL